MTDCFVVTIIIAVIYVCNSRPKFDDGIMERLAKMREPYGIKIEIVENGFGIVKL